MTNTNKSFIFLSTGMLMMLGTVGGIEQCMDLLSMEGVYLAAFALVGAAMLTIGASYAQDAE
jgi:hypothetical protein